MAKSLKNSIKRATRPNARKALNIDWIAEKAGVSTATVSRSLNNPKSVSLELRERISKIISEVGYLRSGAARALASLKSYTVGAVIPTFNNAIFTASINAFEQTLSNGGYTMLATVMNYNLDYEATQVRKLLERGVDALLIVGTAHTNETWKLIEQSGVQPISIWSYDENSKTPCLGFDNEAAMIELVDHLISFGHVKIAMIAGITYDNDRALARTGGYKKALRLSQITLNEDYYIECDYAHEPSRKAFRKLMTLDEPPTAIVCGNDVLAMGAMFEAQDMGISIPDDVSITGYDNLPITEHLRPGLTTMNIPSQELGHDAAQSIINFLDKDIPIKNRLYSTEILIRGTTAAVKKINHNLMEDNYGRV